LFLYKYDKSEYSNRQILYLLLNSLKTNLQDDIHIMVDEFYDLEKMTNLIFGTMLIRKL